MELIYNLFENEGKHILLFKLGFKVIPGGRINNVEAALLILNPD